MRQLKDDLVIWLDFLFKFNGCGVIQEDFVNNGALLLFTDAAGSFGFLGWAFWAGH